MLQQTTHNVEFHKCNVGVMTQLCVFLSCCNVPDVIMHILEEVEEGGGGFTPNTSAFHQKLCGRCTVQLQMVSLALLLHFHLKNCCKASVRYHVCKQRKQRCEQVHAGPK